MPETPMKMIVDVSKPIGHPEREQLLPFTEEEIIAWEQQKIQAEEERLQREAEEAARAEAKASAEAKLAALGLTSDEIAAIVGA